MDKLSAQFDQGWSDTIPMNGVGVIQRDRITFANDRLASIHGYDSRAALVGRDWARTYELCEAEQTAGEVLHSVRKTGPWSGPALGKTRSDTDIPVVLSLQWTGNSVVCTVQEQHDSTQPHHTRTVAANTSDSRADLASGRPDRCAYERLLVQTLTAVFDSVASQQFETTVCERLVDSTLYEAACIGMRTADDERVVPRVSAGITPERLKETLTSGADEDMRLGIRTRACQTGETQIQDIGTDARPVLGEGDGPGTEVRSAAAVPLTHDNAVYGALTVYSARPERELQRERSVLELLGNAVGFGISARKTHKLLYADRVLEFELELTDSRLSLIRLWEQCDCPLRLSDCVASEGNAWSVFLTTEGQFPRGVSAIADADPDIQDIEVLDVDTNGGRVKLVLRESTLTTILGAGAKFTKGHIEDGRARLTFEMPLSGEPRSIINRVQNTYPEATVRSITERDRTVTSLGEFRESIDSTLTGRQREALRRAFARGYFDWPRQTTASEVAESMDIAETTFHYHRRRALQQLLGCYLETGTAAVDADGAED